MGKRLILLIAAVLLNTVLFAQILEPVKWSFESKMINDNEAELIFKATIEEHWHLYSQDIPMTPPATTFTFDTVPGYERIGEVTESEYIEEYDPNFEMTLKYFSDEAIFKQKIKLLSKDPVAVTGYLEFMCCDDTKCLPPSDVEFEFTFNMTSTVQKVTGESDDEAATIAIEPLEIFKEEPVTIDEDEISGDLYVEKSMWDVIIEAIIWGFVALLTPCVFPMIPMTISFFMKGGENKRQGKIQASVYGISIVLLYTLPIAVIILITYFVGGKTVTADIFNWLSTHWIPNIIFFVIFMVFAASFLGMFEIVMPSWMVNKADSKADRGGIIGAFFMAITLVLVSFSCTGPLVGTVLVKSSQGEIFEPIFAMLAFSIAFALPFTLFAFFPSWMHSLPKSGGWLNSVKVILGFIEIALGLKFLSVADQTYHWGILDREVYLAIWIVVFTLMGLYLLGKLKFAHDSDMPFLKVPRFFLAIITFSFVMYLVPGMWGAPLKMLSGYLPPQQTHDFDLNDIIRENANVIGSGEQPLEICEKPIYADFLHLPHGLEGYFDYEQAITCARELKRPLFVDFTGHGCVNCREMEANVWADPRVLKKLREDFVVVALYVDDKTKLPEEQWVTSAYDGKIKKSIGKIFADFQISRFGTNAQPYYALLDNNEKLLVTPKAYDLDVDDFIDFLDQGIAKYKERTASP
ncbi:MAG: cytochrome c biogenesis protein CcdA [Bacteroidota bacterium]|nr:cytochrome c biogenesis protein CcdA [Bacteroidota bacterium]